MTPFVHELHSGRVVFGPGSLGQARAEVERLGCGVALLIADASVREPADRLADALGPLLAGRSDQVAQHVPADVAGEAVRLAAERQADVLVSLGGGSSTGLAKAVARELDLPILAVPTTYAGSEMTPIWGLTERAQKTTGRDARVLPATVIYDPDLTLSMPPRLTATSGLNALAHSAEAMYAPEGSPIIGLIAAESARALAAALPRCVDDPGDAKARSEALYGAWLAGMSLGNTTMGVHHKLCHVLGGAYGLPHAEMHSAMLAYALAFNRDAAPVAMTRLAAALGADDAAAGVWDLAHRIGAPTSVAAIGLASGQVDEAAGLLADTPPHNPRSVTIEGARELLRAAFEGLRPSAAYA